MTDLAIVERAASFEVFSQAFVLDESKEVAWAGARDLMKIRPDIGWVMGRYVQSEQANLNGHIFNLDDLQDRYLDIVHTPLNMLHQERHTVGSYVASELLYPTVGDEIETPYVEALASFWRSVFREEWEATRRAHDNGALAFSMECVPASLGCPECEQDFVYAGLRSETYCDHLNRPRSAKRLNQPQFLGGAIIIPPARPGWSKADVKELASKVDDAEAQALVDAFRQVAPHLDPRQWEDMMLAVLADDEDVKPRFDWSTKLDPGPLKPVGRGAVDRFLAEVQRQDAPEPEHGGVCFVIPVYQFAVDPDVQLDIDVDDELHITLAYGNPTGDLTFDDARRMLEVVGETVTEFDVNIVGSGRFVNDDDIVTWIQPEAEELGQLHDALVDALRFSGVTVNEREYVPHITVSYSQGADDPLPEPKRTTFRAHNVELWWDGKRVGAPLRHKAGDGAL